MAIIIPIIGAASVFTLGFLAGCIWATGRTLDKVDNWRFREAIRKGDDLLEL